MFSILLKYYLHRRFQQKKTHSRKLYMKNVLKNILKFGIPLLLGGILFWYLYRNLDTKQIFSLLKSGIHYQWIILSMLIGLFSHIFRAYRWRLQLITLGVTPTTRSLLNAIFGTYAVNLLFPRLGEIWRCGYMSRRVNLPFTQVLGSVVSDRLTDTLMVMLMCIAVLIFQFPVVMRFLENYPGLEETLRRSFASPWFYIGLLLCILIAGMLYRQKKSGWLITKLRRIALNLWEGFLTILRMKQKGTFILYTVLIWLCYFLQLYVCIFAFQFTRHLSIGDVFTLFTAGSISAGLPVQGGIGAWHFAVISLLVIFGIGQTEAGAFALVAHGAQMVLIILLGIYTVFSIATEKKTIKKEPAVTAI